MSLDEIYRLYLEFPRVSTDSRKVSDGSLFFALKGPNFNGNAFAGEALRKGAAYAVVDEEEHAAGENRILVPDVLACLQQLGTYHRRKCPATVIALTGSNGKTTTKELIAAVLGRKFRTLATEGNLNNHIGVPLTLLRITPETEMAVIEMGANHQQEIAFLSSLAEPDFGYITNFGKAHLEGFGGVEGVIKGKSELYDYLTGNGKMVFINADDPIQREKLHGYAKKVGFSALPGKGYCQIEDLGADPFVRLRVEGIEIVTQLGGAYNFSNCAAAVAMGKYFGVPLSDIREAIEGYVPQNNRSQSVRIGELEIFLDAYNANPSSMAAALRHLGGLKGGRKVAILGDMFELGADAAKEHQAMAELAEQMGLDQVFLVGREFTRTRSGATRFKSFEALADFLRAHPIQGPSTVLIKASRGMALERALEFL